MGKIKKEDKNNSYISWLYELDKNSGQLVGGKGANLAEMFNAKFPVPPAFIINTRGYDYFTKRVKDKINEILSKIDVNETEGLEEKAKQIRELVKNADMPEDLEAEIKEAYENIGVNKQTLEIAKSDALSILQNSHEPIFVAVRSSATTEDLADASFAGQQETYLNVKGEKELIEKVKAVFASLFTARAIYYRKKKGFSDKKFSLAVVVQKMVDSEKSGVMFSSNPIKDNDNVIIEAVFGLGEGIVSGKIKPDNYEVSREMKILDKKILDKKIALVRDSTGNMKEVKLKEEISKEQVLSDSQIKQLANYAIKIEEHYENKPQDIEFAIEAEEIYITQSRPITTQSKKDSNQELQGEEILSGLGASPGIASGKVKIIIDLANLNKVKQGDILVTEMTNPDMVITMQKAAGIITNQGGLTCLAGDTKILTDKGFTTIKEVVENYQGTKVLSLNRENMKIEWKKVIASMKRKSTLIEIETSLTGRMKGNCLRLTPDHKMITFSKRELIDKEIREITQDKNSLLIAQKIPNLLESTQLEENIAYLLGSLSTDGYVTFNNRRGSIILTQKPTLEKKEFIDNVCDIMEEKWGKQAIVRGKMSQGEIRGKKINGSANDYCWYNKSAAIQITQYRNQLTKELLIADEKFIFNYLAGLIDGDGTYNNFSNRINIYCSKQDILENTVIGCLRLGIVPQITINRNISNIQIVERVEEILKYCKRVKGIFNRKSIGTRLFNARQILGDIIESCNYKGRIKPYVNGNLLIDSEKIRERVLPILDKKTKAEVEKILNSDTRMLRTDYSRILGEDFVYNLTIEDNHNFVVFTDRYTPIILNNCHAAIVSREMGIPAVVGTENATEKLQEGQIVSVDGFKGKVYLGKVENVKAEINPIVPTKTKIKVMVDLPEAAERAAKTKADSIGLVRLEGIIAMSGKHPQMFLKEKRTEDYSKLIEKGLLKIAEPFKEIWIRTSDIRSDEYSNLEGAPKEIEANPMLGMHGIRYSLKEKEILKAELNAIKKCAEKYPDKKFGFMAPQIISPEEIIELKKVAEKIGMKNVKTGIMIETPAACLIIKDLLKVGVDFISFGTNDLTQFTLAVDRGNEEVQNIYNEMHPAVLNSIKRVLRTCKEMGVESSICGQAGSNKNMVKFLVENGIDSISTNADASYEISKYVAELEGLEGKEKIKSLNKHETELEEKKKEHKETEELIQEIENKIKTEIDNQIENNFSPKIGTHEHKKQEIPLSNPKEEKRQIPHYIAGIEESTEESYSQYENNFQQKQVEADPLKEVIPINIEEDLELERMQNSQKQDLKTNELKEIDEKDLDEILDFI